MKAISHQPSGLSKKLSCFVVPARAWVLLEKQVIEMVFSANWGRGLVYLSQ
jgi:hypothetical protein